MGWWVGGWGVGGGKGGEGGGREGSGGGWVGGVGNEATNLKKSLRATSLMVIPFLLPC